MYWSILIVLSTMWLSSMIISEKIKSQKLIYSGIEIIIMGVFLHIAAKYFGIPIFSMEYGIRPAVHSGESAEYGVLIFAFFGVVMIGFSGVYEKIIKINNYILSK